MQKLVLLGDSITAGYLNDHVSQALTQRLRTALPDSLRIQNVGIPGDTTRGALVRLEKHVLKGQPDWVTILFGSNDVLLSENIPLADYQANLASIIEQIGAKKVLLLTPSLCNQFLQHEQRPNSRILAYGNAIRQLAQETGATLIDLQASMLDAPDYTVFLQADGLHFSELGYDLLAQLIVEKLTNQL